MELSEANKEATVQNAPESEHESFETNAYVAADVSTRMHHLFGASILDMYNAKTIMRIAKDPMHYARELREISRALYSCNGIVTNTVDYCVALPTLSRVVVVSGKSGTPKTNYKNLANLVLEKIRDKEEIRDGIHNALVEGEYFAYFETAERPKMRETSLSDFDVTVIEEINSVLPVTAGIIHLDPDYTQIIGIKNGSYVLAFDLDYFALEGIEPADKRLLRYPREIRIGYEKYVHGRGKRWVVLDNDHTIAVKFRAKKSEPHGRPLVLAAIDDILYDAHLTGAKRKALDNSGTRIYYQTFPEGKNKGEAALSKEQQRQQHETVKSGITAKGENATTFFSVAAGTKIDALKNDIEILNSTTDTDTRSKISTSMGFAGSLLSGEGTSSFSAQTNNLQLVTAEIMQIIEQISYELNKVINACIIKNKKYRVDVQYLPITHTNRKEFAGMAKELYLQGKGPLSLWASAVGITPEAFFSMMDDELEADVENKYPVHRTSFTQSSDEAGRPVDEDTLNPRTAATRNSGANDAPKPSTM